MKNGALLLGFLSIGATALLSDRANAQTGKVCAAHYEGTLSVKMNDDGRTMELEAPYDFVDADCSRWHVPAKATIDGASIPEVLWSIAGGPYEGNYRNASVIHDWFCSRRIRPWEAVDLMFYHAMIASAVPRARAKIMYLAVYYGGPRWDKLTMQNEQLSGAGNGNLGYKIGDVVNYRPKSIDIHEFQLMMSRIENEDVSIDEIDSMSDDRQKFVATTASR